jgi:hypothetical protein
MADHRAGMAKVSNNALIILLGRAKAAIEIAKTQAEMPIQTMVKIATKIMRKRGRHRIVRTIPLVNQCLKPRAIKPCRNSLYLHLNPRRATLITATLIIETAIKTLLANPIPTRIAHIEAAAAVDN